VSRGEEGGGNLDTITVRKSNDREGGSRERKSQGNLEVILNPRLDQGRPVI